jgi:hypothetical protein
MSTSCRSGSLARLALGAAGSPFPTRSSSFLWPDALGADAHPEPNKKAKLKTQNVKILPPRHQDTKFFNS